MFRWNMVFSMLYAAMALASWPEMRRWPESVRLTLPDPAPASGLVERLIYARPGLVWLSIPACLAAALLLVGGMARFDASRRRGLHPQRVLEYRRRAIAWMSWMLSVTSLAVSVMFYAGWRAAIARDSRVFWGVLRVDVSVAFPTALLFGALCFWSALRAHQESGRRMRA